MNVARAVAGDGVERTHEAIAAGSPTKYADHAFKTAFA
jgi:hypothetical protein